MVVSLNYDWITMQILRKAIRWTGLISLPAFFWIFPNSPADAGEIGSCADSLISSGVAELAAATACSDALQPEDLAACVEDITFDTDVQGIEALNACYRVRRPDELASCVTTIGSGLEVAPTMALDSCRRSLLPERHAECTVDLAGIAEISGEEAMTSCIAAQFTPSEVTPERVEEN